MNAQDLIALAAANPATLCASAGLALAYSHKLAAKYPTLEAGLRVLAHFAGPLNIPAVKVALVAFCRAVVAAADVKDEIARADATFPGLVKDEKAPGVFGGVQFQPIPKAGPPPLPAPATQEIQAAKPTDPVQAWPQQ